MLVARENPWPLSLGDSTDKYYCTPFFPEITLLVYIIIVVVVVSLLILLLCGFCNVDVVVNFYLR